MSFRNRGAFGPTVIVSRLPDRSGNFVCNGTADDVEIQEAIDYVDTFGGGKVYIRNGNYTISNPLDLTGIYEITLEGEARGRVFNYAGGGWVDDGTQLKLANGVDDHLLQMIEGAPAKLTGNTIRDIHFHGNSGNQTPGAVSDVIHLEYVKEVKIENCTIARGVRYGVYLGSSSENNWLLGNRIQQASDGSHCVFLEIAITNRILENIILGATDTNDRGIYLFNNSYRNIIANNAISDCYEGIRLNRCSDNQIHNNEIFDITYIGITLTDTCLDNIISENRIDNVTNQYGIYIGDYGTASENNRVSNNVILSCGTDGIRLDNLSERTQVFENTLKDNGGYGININAATVVNSWVKNNLFDTNASGCLNDGGTDTQVHEIWEQPPNFNANLRDHPSQQMLDGVDTYIRNQAQLPLEFQELVTAQIVVVQTNLANPDVVWTCDTDFGKICAGEDYFQHSDTIGSTTSALAQHDLVCLDISAAFTGVAAGDLVGISFMRDGDNVADTVNAPVYYMGVRIRYV